MRRVNYIEILHIFVFAFVFAVIGMSLPPTINDISNLSERNLYGIWCSYVVSMILFYYVLRIIESIKKLDIKLKKRKLK